MKGFWVLGVAASQHNGAACLMRGDDIVSAIQEERVTRLKRQGIAASRPSAAVAYCLDAAGIAESTLDLVVLCTQTSRNSAEHDVRRNPQFAALARDGKIRFISHHRGHAQSVLAWSGFDDAAILVADGLGSPWGDLPDDEKMLSPDRSDDLSETISTYRARGWALEPLEKYFSPSRNWLRREPSGTVRYQSLGGMYGAFADRIFGDALEAGKVMGLASHAEPDIAVERFVSLSGERVEYANDLPAAVLGARRLHPDSQAAKIASASVQRALEEALLHIARKLRATAAAPNLCFAGGVALNAIANERLIREAGFERVQVIPAADDAGTAFGAAIDGLLGLDFPVAKKAWKSDSHGRVYRTDEIEAAASRFRGLRGSRLHDITRVAACRLAEGEICGWFQGGSEFGPRALGQRSILADPRSRQTKRRLDVFIKHREEFRPYAPVVLLSDAADWFDTGPEPESQFMLRVVSVREEARARIPAVVHVDGTARLQTVAAGGGRYYRLLEDFKEITSVPVLLNTSFNGNGEPIVESPFDALKCFMSGGLDFCVVEDWLFEKEGGVSY